MTPKVGTGKQNIQPSVVELHKKGSIAYKELHTLISGGDIFIRRLKVTKFVYQRCRYVYQNGKRKLVILKTLKRKPRER